MKSSMLKNKLRASELTVGSWITLGGSAVAEILSKAGFDWLVIDLEHSVITIREAEELIRIIELSGVTPLVRLTSNNSDQIKRVMDAGSHGVIVPMINSADEAKRAVNAVKYPPKGSRGFGLARAQGYGVKFKEYLEWQENNAVVIVKIEHIDAVYNLDEIIYVDGVDGYIIGPYDLSGSMGIPGQFDHPDFLEAMELIRNKEAKQNKPGGIHVVEPDIDQLRLKIAEGYIFIAYSVDLRMLDVSARKGVKVFRGV